MHKDSEEPKPDTTHPSKGFTGEGRVPLPIGPVTIEVIGHPCAYLWGYCEGKYEWFCDNSRRGVSCDD